MAWATPPSVSPGTVISAASFGNVVRDDLLYLLTRPAAALKRDNGATYTTTSITFTPIDATNLSITLNVSGSAVYLSLNAVVRNANTDQSALFDFEIDGVRYANTCSNGLARVTPLSTNAPTPLHMAVLVAGLSIGSHTFRPVWRCLAAGAIGLYSGNAVAGEDFLVAFSAHEVG